MYSDNKKSMGTSIAMEVAVKQVLGAFVAAMTFAAVSHASAADLPYKAAPMVAPAFSWTGYYFGVNVGYGVGRDSVSTTTVSGAGFPVLGAGSPLYSPDSDRL